MKLLVIRAVRPIGRGISLPRTLQGLFLAAALLMSGCSNLSLLGGNSGNEVVSSAPPSAQPGDRIALKIWNEPEMSDTFTVAQSGEVILPRLGPTRVDDIPIVQLQDSLRLRYQTLLRNPSVEIVIYRRISVLGEVEEPGIYMADLTMGLPDLIARAGGPTDIGDPNRITVRRGGHTLEFRRSNQAEMFVAELHSGDQVTVGARNILIRNPWATVSTAFGIITMARQLGLF